MEKRRIGKNGPLVSAMGLGCMAMSEFYGPSDDQASQRVIRAALDNGITLLDTADTYGHGHNEELIAKALKGWSGEAFIATKFGIVRVQGEYRRAICGRPDYVRESVEGSLRRLRREVIDLYYVHRIDTDVPIEETVGAMADRVREGKIRYIGLSEPSADTLRRAHGVHPISAVQSEYSLWTRDVETGILETMRELGVALVAYSPLGRGALTGRLDRHSIENEGDFRRFLPRFSGENFEANMARTRSLARLAEEKGCTSAQVALAWLMAKGEDIIPIPGTRGENYLRENIRATRVALSAEEMETLDEDFAPGVICGERYTAEGMAGVNR